MRSSNSSKIHTDAPPQGLGQPLGGLSQLLGGLSLGQYPGCLCTDVQIPPVFYGTSAPFGAKALLTHKAELDRSLNRARIPETITCL